MPTDSTSHPSPASSQESGPSTPKRYLAMAANAVLLAGALVLGPPAAYTLVYNKPAVLSLEGSHPANMLLGSSLLLVVLCVINELYFRHVKPSKPRIGLISSLLLSIITLTAPLVFGQFYLMHLDFGRYQGDWSEPYARYSLGNLLVLLTAFSGLSFFRKHGSVFDLTLSKLKKLFNIEVIDTSAKQAIMTPSELSAEEAKRQADGVDEGRLARDGVVGIVRPGQRRATMSDGAAKAYPGDTTRARQEVQHTA